MSRDRNTKIIAFAALIVGVVGLSIGFAAFSNSLTISSSAQVAPSSSSFRVEPQSLGCERVTGDERVQATADVSLDDRGEGVHLGNISANLYAPGDSVKCTFTLTNNGSLPAYLNSITGMGSPSCAGNYTENGRVPVNYVEAACRGISMTVTLDGNTMTNNTNISNHQLAKNNSETLVLTITYATGSDRADGPFTVSFSDIELNYGSVD